MSLITFRIPPTLIPIEMVSLTTPGCILLKKIRIDLFFSFIMYDVLGVCWNSLSHKKFFSLCFSFLHERRFIKIGNRDTNWEALSYWWFLIFCLQQFSRDPPKLVKNWVLRTWGTISPLISVPGSHEIQPSVSHLLTKQIICNSYKQTYTRVCVCKVWNILSSSYG